MSGVSVPARHVLVVMGLMFDVSHAFHLAPCSPVRSHFQRASTGRLCMQLPSDDDLFASLRARVSQSERKEGPPPPLGPDEVGADSMGPQDVVSHALSIQRPLGA